MTQSNGSLTFVLGEVVLLSATDTDNNTINSGFTSGSTITISTVATVDNSLLDVQLYPNPTSNLITVSIQDINLPEITVEVLDMTGRVINSGRYKGLSNKIGINSSAWENGKYILHLKNMNKEVIGSYQIIKQN
ncbi:T9SS type A sorting domain-containing protein [Crocinitomicaceae bacterium]|nr:T9SS type A sorting domain-containing protein [Crocinitomicaceae bacterium]